MNAREESQKSGAGEVETPKPLDDSTNTSNDEASRLMAREVETPCAVCKGKGVLVTATDGIQIGAPRCYVCRGSGVVSRPRSMAREVETPCATPGLLEEAVGLLREMQEAHAFSLSWAQRTASVLARFSSEEII